MNIINLRRRPQTHAQPPSAPPRRRAGEGGWGGYGRWGRVGMDIEMAGQRKKQQTKNRNVESYENILFESTHNDKFLILKRITNFLSTSFNSFSANCPTLPIAKL
jgi:hypothetical protein